VEVILSPGSFLRLSGDSEFLFSSTSVYNLKLKVVKGSVIIEAAAVDSPIVVEVGGTRFSVVQTGLYRFAVEASGSAVAMIRKGRLQIADKTVKDGKKIVVDGDAAPMISSFDKKAEDDFDLWSKGRAKTLIAANRKLSERAIRRSLSWRGAGNLWLYDPFFRTYTFLPFGYGFNSPYGGGYRTCNPYNPWRNYPTGGSGGGGYIGGGSGSYGGTASGGGSSSGGSYSKGGSSGGVTGTGSGSVSSPPTSGSAGTVTKHP
jgi:hypothetical protein